MVDPLATTTTAATSNSDDNSHHDDWRIALCYCFVPLNDDETVAQHVAFQQTICQERELMGRIRVSPEGVNGVLSGRLNALQEYERLLRESLQSILSLRQHQDEDQQQQQHDLDSSTTTTTTTTSWILDLDVKYCHLHTHLSVSSQLFDSLSVKVTREVVSLFEPTEPSFKGQHGVNPDQRKNYWRRRRRRRHEKQKQDDAVGEGNASTSVNQEDHANVETTSKDETNSSATTAPLSATVLPPILLDKFQPAPHLSPQQWHEQLQQASLLQRSTDNPTTTTTTNHSVQQPTTLNDTSGIPQSQAVLLDARNVYESRVGFFAAPHIPTILANTRKYSDLPKVMQEVACQLSNKDVYMYCTGGVRCERASMYLQAMSQSSLWNADLPPPKRIFQLQGGIQRYLEEYGQIQEQQEQQHQTVSDDNNGCDDQQPDCPDALVDFNTRSTTSSTSLFRGKNFVFDPRRTDPRASKDVVGCCLLCGIPHDDYDNGAAPCEEQEARCQKCRVLLLVCPSCRPTVQWKPNSTTSSKKMSAFQTNNNQNDAGNGNCNGAVLPPLLCGTDKCVDEGNSLNQIATVLLHGN